MTAENDEAMESLATIWNNIVPFGLSRYTSSMNVPARKNIRLQGWDYASHAVYHVTLCTHDRLCLFGDVVHGSDGFEVALSCIGVICDDALSETVGDYPAVTVHARVIMPNHVHILLEIEEGGVAKTLLGSFIRKFKARVTQKAREGDPDAVVWQRGYYDHVIRGERDFDATWEYINNNPAKWAEDKYFTG